MFTALLPAAGNQDQTGTLGVTLVAESTPRSVWSWRSSRLAEPAASDLEVSLPRAGLQATKTALHTGPVEKTGDEFRHEVVTSCLSRSNAAPMSTCSARPRAIGSGLPTPI